MPLQITVTDTAPGAVLTFSAAGLPPGLTINASTGLITGTPTVIGNYNPVITVTDQFGDTGSVTFVWRIVSGTGNTVTVTNPGSQSNRVGFNVSLQMSATDSATGQTLTFNSSTLPPGLSISTSGLITGILTTAGTYNVNVKAIDTTGAFGTAIFTWTVTSPPSAIVAKVGCSVPNQAFTTGQTPPWYDSVFGPKGPDQNQTAADSLFVSIVSRPPSSVHLKTTKKFWNPSDWHFSGNYNDMQNYANIGTRVIACVQPLFYAINARDSGGTPANFTTSSQLTAAQKTAAQQDFQSLVTFLNTLRTMGFTSKTCRIVLWQEPANGGKGVSAITYGNIIRTYGPAVNASVAADGLPFPLIVNVNYVGGGSVNNATDYANAALGLRSFVPTGVTIFGLAMDYYTNSYYRLRGSPPWAPGLLLDATDSNGDSISGIADAQGIPFGLHEFGCPPAQVDPGGAPFTNCRNYFNYITNFMAARVAAGKPNLDCIYYDGQGPPTGQGDITSPVGQDPSTGTLLSASPTNVYNDFRVGLFQALYDAVNGN